MPIPGHTSPPSAAFRTASMPHVGASTHESHSTQPGRSDSGTRRPVASQTGYSSRFEKALALR